MKKLYFLIFLSCFSFNVFSQLGMTYSVIDVTNCITSNGEIIVNGTGGVPPYEYSIIGGGFSSNNHFTGLNVGIYSVGVRDNIGTEYYEDITVNASVGIYIDTLVYNNVLCSGGTGSLTIYTSYQTNVLYSIDNGITFSSSNTFTNLYAGMYFVIVMDTSTYCQDITFVNIIEPPSLTIVVDSFSVATNGVCNGVIDLNPTGGISPYLITWAHTLDTSSYLSGLCAGTYYATIVDQNGCSELDSFNIQNTYDTTYNFIDTTYLTIDTCIFNNSLPVDSSYIQNFSLVGQDSIMFTWVFWQDGSYVILYITEEISAIGSHLVYLEIICDNKSNRAITTYRFYGVLDITAVKINNVEKLNTISIYPNPTRGKIKVKVEGIKKIEVMNIESKNIYNGSETEIDLRNQPKGIYIIKVITDKGTLTKKIIKQ